MGEEGGDEEGEELAKSKSRRASIKLSTSPSSVLNRALFLLDLLESMQNVEKERGGRRKGRRKRNEKNKKNKTFSFLNQS